MKKIYFSFILFLLAVTAYSNPPVNDNNLAEMKRHISASEYFIRWQPEAGIYQSPNRSNDLRATYTGQAVTVRPRQEDSWSFSLSVKNITADGQVAYSPVARPHVIIKENTIQFDHDHLFTVEYVNNEHGVRQNFIIAQQPGLHTEKLSVQLQPAEGWKAIRQSNTALLFKHQQQLLMYKDLKVWDATGKTLAAKFTLHDNQVQIDVEAANAVYPVTIDPIVSNGTPQNANTFLQSNQDHAQMGYNVSGAGDVNADGYDDVILGAVFYDNGQSDEGAAFVYYGTSRGVNPTTYTLLEPNIASMAFGRGVAGVGDVNDDGYDDVAVGAYQYNNYAGAVYLYYGAASGIQSSSPEILTSSAGGELGMSVGGAGDVNGDGYADIIAGARAMNRGQSYEGGAVIFYGGPWGPSFMPSSLLESNIANAQLGYNVAGAGDVNGDGYDDVILGSNYYTNGQTDEGAAYVYYGSSSGILLSPTNIIEGNQANSYFGFDVNSAGDVNGDGFGDVIIGALVYDNGHTDEGAAFIYYGSSSGLLNIARTTLESNLAGAQFGSGVACAGDVNGDGYSDVIVGAREYNDGQSSEGYAFVYYGRAAGLNTTAASIIQSNLGGAQLGFSVAGAGDVNGDGYDDVLIGAPYYSNGQASEGAGFIYHGGLAPARMASPVKAEEEQTAMNTSVKTFPNPAVNNLTVQLQGMDATNSTFVQIMNAQGVLVETIQAGKIKSGNQSVDVSRLPAGVYFIIIKNGTKIFREKVIKQ